MADPAERHCPFEGSGAAARAREELRHYLDDVLACGHLVPQAVQDAVLVVVSELVVNALRHTCGPCTLDLGWAQGGIEIDVTDANPHCSRPRVPDPNGSVRGWGWPLIRRPPAWLAVRTRWALVGIHRARHGRPVRLLRTPHAGNEPPREPSAVGPRPCGDGPHAAPLTFRPRSPIMARQTAPHGANQGGWKRWGVRCYRTIRSGSARTGRPHGSARGPRGSCTRRTTGPGTGWR
ncbi:ATP-binding protein [Streptomyces lavendulae]